MRTEWGMKVPVLSTKHLPGPHALVLDAKHFSAVAEYDCGWFVCWFDDPVVGEPYYISALRSWLRNNYPNEFWVRFDVDGDFVEGLENFEYVWEAMEKSS